MKDEPLHRGYLSRRLMLIIASNWCEVISSRASSASAPGCTSCRTYLIACECRENVYGRMFDPRGCIVRSAVYWCCLVVVDLVYYTYDGWSSASWMNAQSLLHKLVTAAKKNCGLNKENRLPRQRPLSDRNSTSEQSSMPKRLPILKISRRSVADVLSEILGLQQIAIAGTSFDS